MRLPDSRTCIILGGGGHAKVLLDSILQMGGVTVHGILDNNRALWGQEVFGVKILGGDEELADLLETVDCFAVGIGSVGNHYPRQRLFEFGCAHQLEPLSVVHPRSIISPQAEIAQGAQIFPGSIINAGAAIGKNTIINTGAIVEHDCLIAAHVHIATGARLAGAVSVGLGAHIGIGAAIRQGITIGESAIIGAGAVVVKDVPPGQVVIGVPARPFVKTSP